jgi:hypothetical protein
MYQSRNLAVKVWRGVACITRTFGAIERVSSAELYGGLSAGEGRDT